MTSVTTVRPVLAGMADGVMARLLGLQGARRRMVDMMDDRRRPVVAVHGDDVGLRWEAEDQQERQRNRPRLASEDGEALENRPQRSLKPPIGARKKMQHAPRPDGDRPSRGRGAFRRPSCVRVLI